MFCYCRLVRYLSKNGKTFGQRRQFSSKSDKMKFFKKMLDLSSSNESNDFLRQHDYLMKMDQRAVYASYRCLKQIGITNESIRHLPRILCSDRTVLQNRHEILTECGSSTVNAYNLYKYLSLSTETEKCLKCVGIIDNNVNVQQRLAHQLNVKFKPYKEDASLIAVRMHFLRLYFLENKFMTAKEFDSAQFFKHIPYRWPTAVVKILTEQLNIPRNKINDYRCALNGDPENLQQLLKIEPIHGVNIKDILLTRPRLMLRSRDSIERTLNQLKTIGIDCESIKKHSNILMLDSEVIRSRFRNLKGETFDFHPDVSELIVCASKARSRLDQLESLDKKCVNMSALTGSISRFKKFIELDPNKNETADCVLFLSKNLKMDAKEVNIQIRRHPYCASISFAEMKQTIDTLRQAGFELPDIRASIHIVLYSGDAIVQRLEKLSEAKPFEGQRWTDLSKRLQLKLVLYDIEAEHKFSGDGVLLGRKFRSE